MSFLKSLTISDGTNTTEFVAQESEDILMPKADPSDPDVTVAEKIAEIETSIGGVESVLTSINSGNGGN